MTDREPQPGDGPDYHAEHAYWQARQPAPYVATDADLDAIAAEHATRTDLLALRTDALNRTITRAERAEAELAALLGRIQALHRDVFIYETCDDNACEREHDELSSGDFFHADDAPTARVCEVCHDQYGDASDWPCETVALLVPVDAPTLATDTPDTTTELADLRAKVARVEALANDLEADYQRDPYGDFYAGKIRAVLAGGGE